MESPSASHTLRMSRLPAIYADKAKVVKSFDRLCLAELAIRAATAQSGSASSQPPGLGFRSGLAPTALAITE